MVPRRAGVDSVTEATKACALCRPPSRRCRRSASWPGVRSRRPAPAPPALGSVGVGRRRAAPVASAQSVAIDVPGDGAESCAPTHPWSSPSRTAPSAPPTGRAPTASSRRAASTGAGGSGDGRRSSPARATPSPSRPPAATGRTPRRPRPSARSCPRPTTATHARPRRRTGPSASACRSSSASPRRSRHSGRGREAPHGHLHAGRAGRLALDERRGAVAARVVLASRAQGARRRPPRAASSWHRGLGPSTVTRSFTGRRRP